MSKTFLLQVCVIGTKLKPFPVTIDSEASVNELQKVIKRESLGDVGADVPPHLLDLYKVDLQYRPSNFAEKVDQAIKKLQEEKGEDAVLNATLKLHACFDDGYWAAFGGGGYVNVIVQKPPRDDYFTTGGSKRLASDHESDAGTAKRRRESRDLIPPPAWLLAWHKALWNQAHRRDEIFRTAVISFEQLMELEGLLTEKNPSRMNFDDETYTAHLATDIKLKFLRGLPSVPDPPKDIEIQGDDELHPNFEELDTLFPITVRYCDVSSFNINPIGKRCQFPILLREEYKLFDVLLTLLGQQYIGNELFGSGVISGQPGIGKTTYLYVLLLERLLDGKRTYFQDIGGSVFLITDSVTPIRRQGDIGLESESVVALVDADVEVSQPAPVLLTSQRVQVIVTSSPKGSKERKWLRQLGGKVGTTFCMDVWSREELIIAGLLFNDYDIPYHRIHDAISYFGHNPRRCFDASSSNNVLKDRKQEVEVRLQEFVTRAANPTLPELAHGTLVNDQLSHMVFEIRPKDKERYFSMSTVRPVSKWSMQLVLDKFMKGKEMAAREFYDFARRQSTMAPVSGIIWERQASNHFQRLKEPKKFAIRQLKTGVTIPLEYPRNVTTAEFHLRELESILSSAMHLQGSYYLTPVALNFGAADSLFFTPRELVLFQMTIAEDHPIATSSLYAIQRCLKASGPLKYLRPTAKTPWRIIFVVPKELGDSFTYQKFKGRGNEAWETKIEQFVLKLSEDEVWQEAN